MQVFYAPNNSPFNNKGHLASTFHAKDKNDNFKHILLDDYQNTKECQTIINTAIRSNKVLCFKDNKSEYCVIDIDNGEVFEKECNFKDELFEACQFLVFKGLDSKGFKKYHLYFKHCKSLPNELKGIKGIDIFNGKERLLFSHESLAKVKLKESKGEFTAIYEKGSSPFDATEMPKELVSKMAKFLNAPIKTNDTRFVEHKIRSTLSRVSQYKHCNVEIYKQFVRKIQNAKKSDGTYDINALENVGKSLNEQMDAIVFENADKDTKDRFTFTRVHDKIDGDSRRNTFICEHLLTILLKDPSIKKHDDAFDERGKLNLEGELFTILWTIAQSPFVNWDKVDEIEAALKNRLKNTQEFEVFYDANWQETQKTIDKQSEKELANLYIEVIEKHKNEFNGFIPLRTLEKGKTLFWLYNSSKKVDMVGKRWEKDRNPRLVTIQYLNQKFHTKFTQASIPEVEFEFNVKRSERFYYETLTKENKANELLDNDITDDLKDANTTLVFNTCTETPYMYLFKQLDRQELQAQSVRCPEIIDKLVEQLISQSYRIYTENEKAKQIAKLKDYIYKFIAYKLEYRTFTQHAWFFKGEGGTGKSLFTNSLLGKIFGPFHTIARVEDLLNRFNASLENKLFVIVDETDKQAKQLLRVMKQITANKTLSIERKGKDAVNAENYATLIFNTNFKGNLFEKEKVDRREIEFATSLDKLENNPYFARLIKEYGTLDKLINQKLLSDETVKQFIAFLKSLPMDNETLEIVSTQIITDEAKANIDMSSDAVEAITNLLVNKELTVENMEATFAQIEGLDDEITCDKGVGELLTMLNTEKLIRGPSKLVINLSILQALMPQSISLSVLKQVLKRIRNYNMGKDVNIKHRVSEQTARKINEMIAKRSNTGMYKGKEVLSKHHLEFGNLVVIGFTEDEFKCYTSSGDERNFGGSK